MDISKESCENGAREQSIIDTINSISAMQSSLSEVLSSSSATLDILLSKSDPIDGCLVNTVRIISNTINSIIKLETDLKETLEKLAFVVDGPINGEVIIELELKVANLYSQLNAITTSLDIINQTVFSLESGLSNNTGQIADLQITSSTLANSVQSVLSEVDTIRSNLSALEQNYSTLLAQLQSLEKEVATVSDQSNAAKSEVTKLGTTVTDLSSSITSMQQSMNSMQTTITQLQQAMKIPSYRSDSGIDNVTYTVLVVNEPITTFSGYFTLEIFALGNATSTVKMRDSTLVVKPVLYQGKSITLGNIWKGPILMYQTSTSYIIC